MLRPCARAIITLSACTLAACSGDGGPTTLGLPSVSDLSVAALPSTGAFKPIPERVVGTPTEVYTRVARGALTCWFGASGILKGAYIYHADAEPASKGGRSQIVIFVKDREAGDPRSLRAFQILISTVESKTKLETENTKISEPLATRMKSDVARWAADEEGCGEAPVTAGWSAEESHSAPPGPKSKPNAAKK